MNKRERVEMKQNELIQAHGDVLERFRVAVEPLFIRLAEGKSLDRKPAVGLRLHLDEHTRLVVGPYFSYRPPHQGGNELLCDRLHLELLRERPCKAGDLEGWKLTRVLNLGFANEPL